MSSRDLTNQQWQRLQPLLPPQKPQTGRPNEDHRTIVNGILWIDRTGAPAARFARTLWSVVNYCQSLLSPRKAGIWQRILETLQSTCGCSRSTKLESASRRWQRDSRPPTCGGCARGGPRGRSLRTLSRWF